MKKITIALTIITLLSGCDLQMTTDDVHELISNCPKDSTITVGIIGGDKMATCSWVSINEEV